MTNNADPGDRLERALAAYLAAAPTTPADADRLLAANHDLADLLSPMLGHESTEPATPDDARVLGDYRLVRELGRGGMGVVYEAWQRSLDRRVAVKVLAPGLLSSPAAVARFRREANAAGRLHHPHIVEVLGCGSDGDQHFFAMQLIDGVPLHECRARFREPARAVAIATQLADALVHAHAHGVVHRDVKPANVLVRADEQALLMDFGVARDAALPSLTREGGFIGTPDYASPEQIRGETVDGRSDVWSLGVVLYELLTGSHPFAAATQAALLHSILMVEPPSLAGRPGIGNDLAAIVARALTKNCTGRYLSAAALLADLQALARGTTVSARLPTTLERTLRWVRREPWQATAVGALLLGFTAATAGFLLASHRADENAHLAAAESEAKNLYATKVRDFNLIAAVRTYEQTVQRETKLFPAWPVLLPDLDSWLQEDCGGLERLQPEILRGVQSLRAQALPRTEAQRLADRASHPRAAEHQAARRELAWQEAMARAYKATQDGRTHELPPDARELSANKLNELAWRRVAFSLVERQVDNQPELGLAYARAALAHADAGAIEYHLQHTLAHALAANGLDEAAKTATDAVLEQAPERELAGYEISQQALLQAIAARPTALATARAHEQALDAELDHQRTFRLADKPQQFLHDMLVDLLGKLDLLFAEQKVRVSARRQWASRLHDATFAHAEAGASWVAVRAAIAAADDVQASARYRGQAIPLADADVMGLVPIGMNPVTKLWEFYDLRSACEIDGDPRTATIPRHDEQGRITMSEGTGIVFVLLPGGEFAMGAQTTDPDEPHYDAEAPGFTTPVQHVELSPFLIARHEVTQGQWERLCTGGPLERTPAGYPAGSTNFLDGVVTTTHPVERVSWNLAMRVMDENGMTLPTEAQWEYACRAGTTTPWWPGPAKADLAGAANVYDQSAVKHAIQRESGEPFDDGHFLHSPVGSFRANPFGLFDTHGNVSEWCLDPPGINLVGFHAGDGKKRSTPRPDDRTYRGGSFNKQAQLARSSLWGFGPRESRAIDVGVRAVRRLPPR